MKRLTRLFVLVAVTVACCCVHQSAFAQGVLLRGIGAVNASVGGTATAMPLDARGAIHWNPASISALQNEMTFGIELIDATTRVSSSMPNLDGTMSSGSTKGENGVVPIPSTGYIRRSSPRSPFTFGLGTGVVGGASSLYPHDLGNPILSAHGRSSNVIVLQVTPTVAAQVSDRLAIGVAPIVDLASLSINPMSLGRDITPNYDQSLKTYGTRYVWGGGFQVGTLYDFQNNFKAGFMFKSPIWAERLYFSGSRLEGDSLIPATHTFQLNLPMTLSAGISYDGFRNTIIGMDVRYFDYSNAAGLSKGMSGTVVEGLGWQSVYSINLGAQYRVNCRLKVRMGYCWNENPIPSRNAALAVSSPMITQHVLSCGFSYAIGRGLEMSFAYSHAFRASLTGPYGPGSVTNTLSANSFFTSISKKW